MDEIDAGFQQNITEVIDVSFLVKPPKDTYTATTLVLILSIVEEVSTSGSL